MTVDRTPDVPRYWHPQQPARPAAGPAWAAGWALLSDLEPHPRPEVIAAMREASPISYRTARDILQQAVKTGLLEVVDRDRYTRPILRRPS
jgi:hypothetical protein